MKQFDLVKAKTGAPVCTRDGRDVRIVCWDKKGDRPLVVVTSDRYVCGCDFSYDARENGRVYSSDDLHELDLFMKDPEPTLDDYTTIKTYEDACKVLGERPIEDVWMIVNQRREKVPSHIIAMMKLETISRALWGNWRPSGRNDIYFAQIEVLENGKPRYWGWRCSKYSVPAQSLRLAQETGDKAEYFGTQFLDLWEEYLGM